MRSWMLVLVLGGLLGAALVAAWFTWTTDEETPRLEVAVWGTAAEERAPDELRLEAAGQTVELALRERGQPWMKVSSRPRTKPADSGAPAPVTTAGAADPVVTAKAGGTDSSAAPSSERDGSAATVATSGTDAPAVLRPGSGATTSAGPDAVAPSTGDGPAELVEIFLGNDRSRELLVQVAGLRAKRELESPTGEQLGELGLQDSTERLVVVAGGGQKVLTLGGEVFGSGQRYLRNEHNGRIYVVEGRIFQDLAQAKNRLMERELHGFTPNEPDRVELAVGARQRSLVRKTTGRPGWAPVDSPDTSDEQAGTWLGKVNRLRIVAYEQPPDALLPATTSQAPTSGAPAADEGALVLLRYSKDGQELGFLELFRQEVQAGSPRYLARSERTAGRRAEVTGFLAEEVARDLGSILGDQPAAATP